MFQFIEDEDGKILVWFRSQPKSMFIRHIVGDSGVVPVIAIEYPHTHLPGALIIGQKMKELEQSPYIFMDEKKERVDIEIYFYLEVDKKFLPQLYPPLSRVKGLDNDVRIGMGTFCGSKKEDIAPLIELSKGFGTLRIDIGKFSSHGISLYSNQLIYDDGDLESNLVH